MRDSYERSSSNYSIINWCVCGGCLSVSVCVQHCILVEYFTIICEIACVLQLDGHEFACVCLSAYLAYSVCFRESVSLLMCLRDVG